MPHAPGKTAAEKMKHIAAKWRKMKHGTKSKGGLVYAPGSHGRSIKLHKRKGKGGDYTDWGDKPDIDGEGIWSDIIKPLGKKALQKGVDLLIEKGGPKLAEWASSKSPLVGKIINTALEHGGKKLADLAKSKIEGLGVRHANKWLKEHMAANPKKQRGRKGGALSGLVGPRQKAALDNYIKHGGHLLHR